MTERQTQFTGKAAAYTKGRPLYAQASLNFLKEQGVNEKAFVADIGAGTGIFSKQLAENGATVYAVEPNEDMRSTAKEYLKDIKNVHCIDGSAEETTLPDCNIDFVCAAQAFHWFDKDLFRKECLRVLRPEGKIVLIWNIEIFGNRFFQDYGEILNRLTTNGTPKTNEGNPYDIFFNQAEDFLSEYERLEFDNTLYMNEETFLYKTLSSSASPKENDANHEPLKRELKNLFARYQENKTLVYPHKTVMYIGKI